MHAAMFTVPANIKTPIRISTPANCSGHRSIPLAFHTHVHGHKQIQTSHVPRCTPQRNKQRPQPQVAFLSLKVSASSNTQLLTEAFPFPLDAASQVIARQPSVLHMEGLADWLAFFTEYGVQQDGLRRMLLFSADVLQTSTPYVAGVFLSTRVTRCDWFGFSIQLLQLHTNA